MRCRTSSAKALSRGTQYLAGWFASPEKKAVGMGQMLAYKTRTDRVPGQKNHQGRELQDANTSKDRTKSMAIGRKEAVPAINTAAASTIQCAESGNHSCHVHKSP